MPKKSKRDKIIADLRRKIPKNSDLEHTNEVKYTFSPAYSSPRNTHPSPPADNKELSFIKKDLTKTIILATVAISFELALFWIKKGNI